MRNLLLITYHFPPSSASGAFRMLGFARHLPKFGWRTVVVAPPRMPLEPVDPGLQDRIPAGTPVYHVPYPQGLVSRPLRRLAPRAIWLPRAWLACGRAVREHRPDAILTSGPPHVVHLLGLLLHERHGIPWVADFRDPWVSGVRASGMRPPKARVAALLERAVLRRADVVVANAPRAAEVYREAYPAQREKIVVVSNGYDPEDFVAPEAECSANTAVRIVHTGELYANRDPRPFLDAIRDLGCERDRKKPLQVQFLGRSGDASFDLAEEVQKRGLADAVSIGGQVPHAESIRALIGADILLLLDTPGRSVGVPAKLYEYLGAGRPILALGEQDGDLARVLCESGALYRVVAPGDADAIKRAVAELAAGAGLANGQSEVSRSVSSRSPFTRENLARKLANILDGLTQPVPASSVADQADRASVRIHPAHAVAAGKWDERSEQL